MGLLSWLLHSEPADTDRIDRTLERILVLHPPLRLARRCRQRLGPAIARSIAFLDELTASLPAPRDASAAAWSRDPCMRAFFVSAEEVARVISRSADLRNYFDRNPELPQAYAVLGMEMTERHILGVGLEGDTLRRDVPQTTLSFGDHQVRICGPTEADLRDEIGRRLLDQLALEGLARIAGDKSRRDVLERERALLATRLRLLERQGAGIRSVLGDDAAVELEERARLQADIEENERSLTGLGLRSDALDRELDHVRTVLAEPDRHIHVSSRRVRLDRMNVIRDRLDAQDGEDIEFHFARIPTAPPRTRAFSLVRFARTDMLPAASLLDEAQRLLASGVLS